MRNKILSDILSLVTSSSNVSVDVWKALEQVKHIVGIAVSRLYDAPLSINKSYLYKNNNILKPGCHNAFSQQRPYNYMVLSEEYS